MRISYTTCEREWKRCYTECLSLICCSSGCLANMNARSSTDISDRRNYGRFAYERNRNLLERNLHIQGSKIVNHDILLFGINIDMLEYSRNLRRKSDTDMEAHRFSFAFGEKFHERHICVL
ncbi:hypothetical protein QQG55_22050 [Brugia pahangi]